MADKFKVDDEVRIFNTGSYIDGITGFVLGISSRHAEVEFYMIGHLSRALTDRPDIAINLIGSCLEKV